MYVSFIGLFLCFFLKAFFLLPFKLAADFFKCSLGFSLTDFGYEKFGGYPFDFSFAVYFDVEDRIVITIFFVAGILLS